MTTLLQIESRIKSTRTIQQRYEAISPQLKQMSWTDVHERLTRKYHFPREFAHSLIDDLSANITPAQFVINSNEEISEYFLTEWNKKYQVLEMLFMAEFIPQINIIYRLYLQYKLNKIAKKEQIAWVSSRTAQRTE